MDEKNIIDILQAHEEAIKQLGQDIELIKIMLRRDKQNQESISEEEE